MQKALSTAAIAAVIALATRPRPVAVPVVHLADKFGTTRAERCRARTTRKAAARKAARRAIRTAPEPPGSLPRPAGWPSIFLRLGD